LREINPLLHERYLGKIEVVKEASALKQALTASLKAKLPKAKVIAFPDYLSSPFVKIVRY
jgi:hypothetical protein